MNKIINLAVSILFIAFSSQAQHAHTEANSIATQTTDTNTDNDTGQFKHQLTAVYQASLQVKEALVAGDTKKAQQAAQETSKSLSKIDMTLLKDKAHQDWMNYQKDIKSNLDKIVNVDKIKVQREAFAKLSEGLYKSLKAFGVEGKEVYYQHCPMALEGEGAYWLSDSKQIRNPYLGDKMLTCGSTKETLK